jgi:hypothetical protein
MERTVGGDLHCERTNITLHLQGSQKVQVKV